MKGLYFYKLSSPYQEDVTKDCKLTINEIDHNFVTLKNTDIKDIKFDEETGLLTLSQINGDEFIAKIDLSHFTRDFNVEWDKENSALIFNFDGKEVKIDEFISTIVDNSVTNVVQEIISQTITDNTLVGVGVGKNPLGINPLEIPGTYKAVERLVNKIEGEYLPDKDLLKKGDRFLTYEKLNLYGNLYNYESIKKIDNDLKNGWRVPSKEDWDNMLDAIELCDEYKNHSSKDCNKDAGKYAGKLLKFNEYWKENDDEDVNENENEPKINSESTRGVDAYGFSVLPAGYGDGYGSFDHFGYQSDFWSLTETEQSDVYVKRFFYNKSCIVQIAKAPNALCSLRLVKDYDGSNFYGVETINGVNYRTVLVPSKDSEHGFSIWIASNVAFDDDIYNPSFIEQENMLFDETAYYVNEWDGFKWLKKQLIDGDSIVIKNGYDGDINSDYRLVGNVLVNKKREIEDFVNNLNCETIEQEGGYVSSISQENGVVFASTKTLVNNEDKLLTYSDEGIFTTIDVQECDGDYESGVKKIYKLVDKNQEIIGQPIVINENVTNETYVSTDIPVAGGPLASLVEGTTQVISAGTNIQDLLFTLFCKEKYPENPRFNEGSISAQIVAPSFCVYESGTTIALSNNVEVEVGTKIEVSSLVSPKTTYTVHDSIWTGFDYGYSVSNDNTKDGNGNPIKLNNTEPIQVTNYLLSRVFSGFDNKVLNQTANTNEDNTKVVVSEIVDVTVADGINTITSNVSGATYSTTFSADVLGYYACSNLKNTKSEKYVNGYTHTKTTNLPTNSYSINIKGMRYSFVGALNNTFNPTSENVRTLLTKYAFNKTNTNKLIANSGNICVVIAYPKDWGEIKEIRDVNAMNSPILGSFEKTIINVEGANGYTAKPYYVYVYNADIVLGNINYDIFFE